MSASAIPLIRDLKRDAMLENIMEQRLEDEALLASLATEFAMGINDARTIIQNHGLTVERFEDIARKPRFQGLLAEANIAWNSSEKARTRIRVKMETALEQALPHLFKELVNDGLSGAKVELVKAIMKGSGIGDDAGPGGVAGGGVRIVINAGITDKPPVVIDHQAEEA